MLKKILLFLICFYKIQGSIHKDRSGNLVHENGAHFQSYGVSLYPFWSYYTQTVSLHQRMSALPAYGLSSVRIVLIFEPIYRKCYKGALYERFVWQAVDRVFEYANQYRLWVTLELSSLINYLESCQRNGYAEKERQEWYNLVDWVVQRYQNQTYLWLYTILGEVIPITSKQKEIIRLAADVSHYLRRKDPSRLIGSGGLLHMSPLSGYHNPNPYWQDIYRLEHIDVCMIHIYQNITKLDTTEWDRLPIYQGFCKKLGKPFIIDEWGFNRDLYSPMEAARYIKYVLKKSYSYSVLQMWNWKPGKTFDWYPFTDTHSYILQTQKVVESRKQIILFRMFHK